MKNQKKKIILGSCIFLAFICTCAYALLSERAILKGTIQTGKVEIELISKEPQKKNTQFVMAGQRLPYQPKIRIKGAPCYIRVTAKLRIKQTVHNEPHAMPHLKQNSGWVRKGIYFYYTKPLEQGDTVTPFTEIHVPEDWNEHFLSFSIHLTADALQSGSVSPDFSSRAPWGSVEIQEDKKGTYCEYRTVRKTEVNSIIYRGNNFFEISASDLFETFPALSPGDSASAFIELRNETCHPVQIEIKIKAPRQALLAHTHVSLFVDGCHLRSDTLTSSVFKNFQPLISLNAGEKKYLKCVLFLPANLDNRFSLETESVVWYLRSKDPQSSKSPQTGEPLSLYWAILSMLGSAIILFLIRIRKKGGNK